ESRARMRPRQRRERAAERDHPEGQGDRAEESDDEAEHGEERLRAVRPVDAGESAGGGRAEQDELKDDPSLPAPAELGHARHVPLYSGTLKLCLRPSSSARSGATREKGRSSTCSRSARMWSAATRAGRTRGTRSSPAARLSRSVRRRAA